MLIFHNKVSMDVFGHITDKCTPSRPLGEVKLSRAWLVVRWVTTCEAQVLKAVDNFAFLHFFLFIECVSSSSKRNQFLAFTFCRFILWLSLHAWRHEYFYSSILKQIAVDSSNLNLMSGIVRM